MKLKKFLKSAYCVALAAVLVTGNITPVLAQEDNTMTEDELLEAFGVDKNGIEQDQQEMAVGPWGNGAMLVNPYMEAASVIWYGGRVDNNDENSTFITGNLDLNKNSEGFVDNGRTDTGNQLSNAKTLKRLNGNKNAFRTIQEAYLDTDGDGIQETVADLVLEGNALYLKFRTTSQDISNAYKSYQLGTTTGSQFFFGDQDRYFYSFMNRSYNAGIAINAADFDGDGVQELAAAYGNKLHIFDVCASKGKVTDKGAEKIFDLPYKQTHSRANTVSLNVGDINGDGLWELIVAQRDKVKIYAADKTNKDTDNPLKNVSITDMKPVNLASSKDDKAIYEMKFGKGNACRVNAIYADTEYQTKGKDKIAFDGGMNKELVVAWSEEGEIMTSTMLYTSDENNACIGTFSNPVFQTTVAKTWVKEKDKQHNYLSYNVDGLKKGVNIDNRDSNGKNLGGKQYYVTQGTVEDFFFPVPLAAARMKQADSNETNNIYQDTFFINNDIYRQKSTGDTYKFERVNSSSEKNGNYSCSSNYSKKIYDTQVGADYKTKSGAIYYCADYKPNNDHHYTQCVTKVVSGNFTGSKDLLEQFVFIASDSGTGDDLDNVKNFADKDNPHSSRYHYCMRYVTEAGGDYQVASEAVKTKNSIETSDFFGIVGNSQDKGKTQEGKNNDACVGFTGDYGCQMTLAAVNTDNDSRYGVFKSSEIIYDEPKLLAVLQAAPYFSDTGSGSDSTRSTTTWGQTETNGSTKGRTNTGSLSLTLGTSPAIIPGVLSATLTETLKYTYSQSTADTLKEAMGYTFSTCENNAAVTVVLPKVKYKYQLYNKSENKWYDTEMLLDMTPVFKTMSLEEYDALVKQYKKSKKDTKLPLLCEEGKEVLKNVSGNPYSYQNQNLNKAVKNGNWMENTYEADDIKNSKSQSVSETVESSQTVINSIDGSVTCGTTGLVVCTVTEGIGESFSSGTISGSTDSMTGTVASGYGTYEEAKGSFNWRMATFRNGYNGTRLDLTDTKADSYVVIAYDVKNIVSPPRKPLNLTIIDTKCDYDTTGVKCSTTLTWNTPAQASSLEPAADGFILKRKMQDSSTASEIKIAKGDSNLKKLGINEKGETVWQYTDTDDKLNADSCYDYSVKAYSKKAGKEVLGISSTVATAFINGKETEKIAPVIYQQPKDFNGNLGDKAELKIKAEYQLINGNPIKYMWQRYDEKNKQWVDLYTDPSQRYDTYIIESVHQENIGQYRCCVQQNIDGRMIKVYSNIVNVSIQ